MIDKKEFSLLLRSFDAELNASDSRSLHGALERSAELKAEQKRLLALRENCSLCRADCLAPQFSDLVMQSIRLRGADGPNALVAALLAAFRPLALASAIVIALLASFNAYYTASSSNRGAGMDEVLAMIQDAHSLSLSLEAHLCEPK